MIQLKSDCLVFQTSCGQQIPCAAEWVTLELLGETASLIDPEIVRNAAAAVLHYFKHEQGRDFVSVAEFAAAFEKVLHGLGVRVYSEEAASPLDEPVEFTAAPAPLLVAESDLRTLAHAAGKGCELFFFPNLRDEVKRKLDQSPQVLRFSGLRGCVKQLSGAHRWSPRCQSLNDQIVEFLRNCWQSEAGSRSCSLVVS